ncbi:transposase [Actinacidiphila alni]|uniref:transposase n=1 Tax=Actinacidiphila alni TaxID=380248 RepID=UPI00340FCA46
MGSAGAFAAGGNNRCGHRRDHRQVINGIIHQLSAGCQWRQLPARFGPWQTIHKRHSLWSAAGHLGAAAPARRRRSYQFAASTSGYLKRGPAKISSHAHAHAPMLGGGGAKFHGQAGVLARLSADAPRPGGVPPGSTQLSSRPAVRCTSRTVCPRKTMVEQRSSTAPGIFIPTSSRNIAGLSVETISGIHVSAVAARPTGVRKTHRLPTTRMPGGQGNQRTVIDARIPVNTGQVDATSDPTPREQHGLRWSAPPRGLRLPPSSSPRSPRRSDIGTAGPPGPTNVQ